MKNIVIIGVGRAGKTTLSNMIIIEKILKHRKNGNMEMSFKKH